MTTSADIVNRALQLIGDNQPPVSGNAPSFDDSTAGKAAAKVYAGVVQTVGRQADWDFARNTVALALSGNVAPFPWQLEYVYPSNGVQVWQVMAPSSADLNNPLPTNWVVANAVVGSAQKRVIHTNVVGALALYNNNPNEDTWDSLFTESVVRLLASELAMAISGKPDVSDAMLQSGAAFESIGEKKDS